MTILLATDGSEGADQAVEFLTRLPRSWATEVLVVHVIERVPFSSESEIEPDELEALVAIQAQLHTEANEIVQRTFRRLEDAGAAVRTMIRTGEPTTEILEAAETSKADQIVLGASGVGARERLGRTARRVLKHANVGVVVTRALESEQGELGVLLAFDGSDASRGAVELARGLLTETTRVTLLSVLTVATSLYRFDIAERMSATWRTHKEKLERELEEVADDLRTISPNVETRILDGGTDAADEILDATRLLRPDVTIVGRSGKGAFRKWVLGSVSEALAEFAPCSVWVAAHPPTD